MIVLLQSSFFKKNYFNIFPFRDIILGGNKKILFIIFIIGMICVCFGKRGFDDEKDWR